MIDVDIANKFGFSAAHFAAINGNISIIKILFESGANMTALNAGLYTPLHYAIEYDHDEVAKFLIENVAIVENDYSYSLLLQMTAEKKSNYFMELIKAKNPFGVINHLKWNILHFAAANGNEIIINLLHENISPKIIKKKDKNGRNPLIIAAINNNLDFIKLLDKYGLGYFNEKDKFDILFYNLKLPFIMLLNLDIQIL